MEGPGWKETVIIPSFDHFAQATNELDMFLVLKVRNAEKTHKNHSYFALEAGKVLVQEAQPVLSWSSHVSNICTVLPITNR